MVIDTFEQYKVTLNQRTKFIEALLKLTHAEHENDSDDMLDNMNPIRRQAVIDSIEGVLDDLASQITDYENRLWSLVSAENKEATSDSVLTKNSIPTNIEKMSLEELKIWGRDVLFSQSATAYDIYLPYSLEELADACEALGVGKPGRALSSPKYGYNEFVATYMIDPNTPDNHIFDYEFKADGFITTVKKSLAHHIANVFALRYIVIMEMNAVSNGN